MPVPYHMSLQGKLRGARVPSPWSGVWDLLPGGVGSTPGGFFQMQVEPLGNTGCHRGAIAVLHPQIPH